MAEGTTKTSKKKYLALCWNRNALGYASFDKETGVVNVGEVREYESFLNLHQLREDIAPYSIIVPSGSDTRFVAAIKRPTAAGGLSDVVVVSKRDFLSENCIARLAPELDLTDEECAARLQQVLDVACTQAMRSLSGLLSRVAGIAPITQIHQQKGSTSLLVDTTSLSALQVFKRLAHPSAHNGIGASKEGLSVFGILNTCKTRMGTETLRDWLCHPTSDADVLRARLNTIDIFVAEHNAEAVGSLRAHMKYFKPPHDIIRKFQEYSHAVKHWQSLMQMLYAIPVVVRLCLQLGHGSRAKVFSDVANAYDEAQCAVLCKRVVDTIDIAASQSGRVIVKWGVDADLDRHKEAYEGLRSFLDAVAKTVAQDLHPFAYALSVDYYPQLGYFVTIGISYFNDHLTTNLPNPSYQYQFKSDEKLFYKNARMRELDEQYGDIYSAIVDMETEVVNDLMQFVTEPANVAVLSVAKHVAVLDCLLALASVSKEECWCRPSVVQDNVLRIVGGRHPIQEKVVESFVANDTAITTEGRVCVITGPNASGKSVYLKQVALIVFLAHVGCYVPAREAVIGKTDRIFTRMRSKASSPSSPGTSAFASDVSDIVEMMKYSTEHTTLVIDEFGKGTVTSDGMALLAAVLRHFLARGALCPKLLVSTHYTEILSANLIPPSPTLSVKHMSVERDTDADAGEEIVYKYKLCSGTAESSFALFCAAQAGVPKGILDRAAYLHMLLGKVPVSSLKRLLESTPDTVASNMQVFRVLDTNLALSDSDDLRAKLDELARIS